MKALLTLTILSLASVFTGCETTPDTLPADRVYVTFHPAVSQTFPPRPKSYLSLDDPVDLHNITNCDILPNLVTVTRSSDEELLQQDYVKIGVLSVNVGEYLTILVTNLFFYSAWTNGADVINGYLFIHMDENVRYGKGAITTTYDRPGIGNSTARVTDTLYTYSTAETISQGSEYIYGTLWRRKD